MFGTTSLKYLEILRTYPRQSLWDRYFTYSSLLVAIVYTCTKYAWEIGKYFPSITHAPMRMVPCAPRMETVGEC